MTSQARPRSPRRTDALSRERILETAVELLDADGEGGLTSRALTERLATGPGAIYHHVGNKDELLGAATDAVVAAALAVRPGGTRRSPRDEIRTVALGLFDAVEQHPWLAAQLATRLPRTPWGSVMPRLFESVGRHLRALGVPESDWFMASSALVHYILGAVGQNAANVRVASSDVDRSAYLHAAAAAWEALDPDEFPFLRVVAGQMRDHDDREQFLAGVDVVITGVTAARPPAG